MIKGGEREKSNLFAQKFKNAKTMVTCSNCDKENDPGSKFCIDCGQDLAVKTPLAAGDKKQIELGSKMIGAPVLLEGERVLAEFKASLWDLGLFGYLLGSRERIVITTHRVFHFSGRLTGEVVKSLFLRSVEAVAVVNSWNLVKAGIGAAMVLFGIFVPSEDNAGYGELGLDWFLKLLIIAFGAFLIFLANTKVIKVVGGSSKNAIAYPFKRMKKEDLRRFVDLVSKSAEMLNR